MTLFYNLPQVAVNGIAVLDGLKHTLKPTDFILLHIPEVELLSFELSLFGAKMKL